MRRRAGGLWVAGEGLSRCFLSLTSCAEQLRGQPLRAAGELPGWPLVTIPPPPVLPPPGDENGSPSLSQGGGVLACVSWHLGGESPGTFQNAALSSPPSPLVAVAGPDRGLRVPAGREWQDGTLPGPLCHHQPTLAASARELPLHWAPEGQSAAGCGPRASSPATFGRGPVQHFPALGRGAQHHGGSSCD